MSNDKSDFFRTQKSFDSIEINCGVAKSMSNKWTIDDLKPSVWKTTYFIGNINRRNCAVKSRLEVPNIIAQSQSSIIKLSIGKEAIAVLKVDFKIMGPKVRRVQWGCGPKSLPRMNHIPEKASRADPYTEEANSSTEGWNSVYLFIQMLFQQV